MTDFVFFSLYLCFSQTKYFCVLLLNQHQTAQKAWGLCYFHSAVRCSFSLFHSLSLYIYIYITVSKPFSTINSLLGPGRGARHAAIRKFQSTATAPSETRRVILRSVQTFRLWFFAFPVPFASWQDLRCLIDLEILLPAKGTIFCLSNSFKVYFYVTSIAI